MTTSNQDSQHIDPYIEEEPDWFRLRRLEATILELGKRVKKIETIAVDASQSALICPTCGSRMLVCDFNLHPTLGSFGYYSALLSCNSCDTVRRNIISDVSAD